MFKNIVRIIGILAAIVLLIAGALVLAFHILFPESRLKKITVDGVRGFTMRDASVGRVSVGFTGLEVTDFSLSDFPDFAAGTFISAPRFSITFRPLALLQHRLLINEARLDSPHLSVTLNKDGTSSFDNLTVKHERKYVPLALLVTDCRISDGQVVLKDERTGTFTLTARNVNLVVGNVSITAPFPVRMTADIEKNGILQVEANGTVDIARKSFSIEPLTIKNGAAVLTVSGSIDHFMDKRPGFNLAIKGDRAALDKVLQLFPWASALQFGFSPQIDVVISGNTDNLKIRFNKI